MSTNGEPPGRLAGIVPKAYVDLAKVVGGTFSRNAFRGLLKLLVAGFLAPGAMGILRSVFSFFKITATVAELGLDHAMVTFAAGAGRKDEGHDRDQVFKTVLFVKIAVAMGLLVAGNLLARKLAVWVLSDPELTIYVRLAFLGVTGQLVWKYVSSYFSSRQEFGRLGLFLSTMPVLMLIATVLLIVFDRFGPGTAIAVYVLGPGVSAALWWLVLDRSFIKRRGWDKALIGRIFRFSRWVYLTEATSSVRNHVNPLLLKNPGLSGSAAAGETNAGLYGFGSDLAAEITVLTESALTVLLPKASTRSGARELKRFLRKAYRNLAVMIVPIALLMFLAKPMLHLLAMVKPSYLAYLPSLKVFMILYCGAIFSLVAIPMRTVLYSIRKPHVETWLEVAMVVLLIGGGIVLIPRFGCTGAAIVVFVQRVATCVVVLVYGIVSLAKMPEDAAA